MKFIKICNPKLNSEITISLESSIEIEVLLRRIIQDCLVKSQLICDITVGNEEAKEDAR